MYKCVCVCSQAQFPALSGSTDAGASSNVSGNKGKTSKLQKDEETVQRLFNSMKPKDEFTQWCADSLRGLPSEVDSQYTASFSINVIAIDKLICSLLSTCCFHAITTVTQ